MGIVVVSMRAARLASCKDNEADFRLKNYKSIFSYLAVRGIKPSEVFINESKSRHIAESNLRQSKNLSIWYKVKPKKLLYFASSRHGFIFHVSHRSKIRLRHIIFLENENPHEFYNHCWDRKILEDNFRFFCII